MFPLSCKQVAWELAPKLTVIFIHLVKENNFLACWRLADDVPVSKNLPLRMLETTCLSLLLQSYQMYLKSLRLERSQFLEGNSLLSPSQFLYRRGLGTCDAFLTLSLHLRVALHMTWRDDLFSWTFLLHLIGLASAVCYISSIGVGAQFLSIVSDFLSNRRQCLHLDGKVNTSVGWCGSGGTPG